MKKYAIIHYVHYNNYGTQSGNSKTLFEYEALSERDSTFGFRNLINSHLIKTTDPGLVEGLKLDKNGPIIDVEGCGGNDFIFECETEEEAILIYEVS